MKLKTDTKKKLPSDPVSGKVWKQARFDCFYYDDSADRNYPCEVRISETEIVVSYQGDAGFETYLGRNQGNGHFDLKAPEVNGHAVLHRFSPESNYLDGYWVQGNSKGMWRIELIESSS